MDPVAKEKKMLCKLNVAYSCAIYHKSGSGFLTPIEKPDLTMPCVAQGNHPLVTSDQGCIF